ncbi:MAG: stage 0 sporulation family protein [Oscillospiraceae bacterium]|nr:stage 0 sporulation family protein [Oscillospiraceae bacterium]
MIEVVSVKFNDSGKVYFFDPQGIAVDRGDHVVVETVKGVSYGECVYGNHGVNDDIVIMPLRPVIRKATEYDRRLAAASRDRSPEDMRICQRKIDELRLPMKLVSSESNFDASLITFYFAADSRVDFRQLVSELSQTLKTRVRLVQVGARDEAKIVGGLGICGKQLCCSQFLREFHPVSIKMAKTQGLSLNPVKLSGTCGKLMCCLKYEQEAYEELVPLAPKINAFVETPYGKGSVVGVNLLRGVAKVRLEDGNDATLKSVPFAELEVLGGKGRRAEYQAAKAEGRLEEAGFKPSVIRRSAPLVIPDFLSAPRPEPADKDAAKRGGGGNDGGGKRGSKNRERVEPSDEMSEILASAGIGGSTSAPRPEPVKKPGGRRGGYKKNKRRGGEGA